MFPLFIYFVDSNWFNLASVAWVSGSLLKGLFNLADVLRWFSSDANVNCWLALIVLMMECWCCVLSVIALPPHMIISSLSNRWVRSVSCDPQPHYNTNTQSHSTLCSSRDPQLLKISLKWISLFSSVRFENTCSYIFL